MNRLLNYYHKQIVWALCFFTVLRLFIGNAAFPFFNNVDEHAHFDLIIKYSFGHLPTKESKSFNEESMRLISLFDSPEYFYRPEYYESKQIPPPTWTLEEDKKKQELETEIKIWKEKKNHEEFSPPVYYSLAALWYKIGKLVGMKDGVSIYWIRFLNVFIYVTLFWVTYFFIRGIYPENISIHLSILSLLSVFPQDVFYSLNSDVLSSLFALLTILFLSKIYFLEASISHYLLAGLFLSFAFLSKIANIPLVVTCALILLLYLKKLLSLREQTQNYYKLFYFVIASLLPVSLWIFYNWTVLGDLMGTSDKIHELGWTIKPSSEILNHPIFTWKGLSYFLSNVFKTFWRGELMWGMRRLASSNSDSFYVISSSLFILVSVFHSFVLRKENDVKIRFIKLLSIIYIILSILFLVILSIIYDFGPCIYPSPELPYFDAGRLMIGMLIPFLILYLDGLRVILERISQRLNLFIVVFLISIFVSHYETVSLIMVMKSKYNWFYL